MMSGRLILVLAALVAVLVTQTRAQASMEERAKQFLKWVDDNATVLVYDYTRASWDYNTDITQENADKEGEMAAIWGAYYSKASKESNAFDINQITDRMTKLQLIALQDKGSGVLPQDKLDHLNEVMGKMSTLYSTGTVCMMDDPFDCQTLEPGLESIMASSRDYYERLHVWEGWRVEVGKKMRPLYEDYVDLKNEAAKLNGYADYGAYWRSNYETIDTGDYHYTRDDLMKDVRVIYQEIMPLYTELHAYVRAKLQDTYPGHIQSDGGLPAHLLGDMWGRFWTNLYPLAVPYPHKPDIDVTKAMVEQGWTIRQMFDSAEDFFMSVGLFELFPSFWTNSMIEKPDDGRKVVCHPTAWDMGNREDYRIKMCSKVNMDDFLTVHHELGHIQYNMAYRALPYLLRDGANEGFHEAVGEIMSLSAATPKHLKALGLLDANFTDDTETEINFLMKQALTIVATLPFTYMLEEWRWQVFQDNIPKEKWMEDWWDMKNELVGVIEPLPRDETYCDPPALFHVSGDYSFIRYFTRTIYQFQFQKALCDAAGHTGPLFKCDITGSKEAGAKLKAMLELGKSTSWTRALEQVSGETRMNSKPLMDYFSVLHDWLVEENRKNNRVPGWKNSQDSFSADAFKVRLSLKAAMGAEAYAWNDNELYLFKTTMAYAMRQYYSEKGQHLEFKSDNVYTYKETPRVSFFFVVTDPTNPSKTIPKSEVEAAIRLSRGRINSAFLLDDNTLDFEGLMATLAPPAEPAVEVWLIVFGSIMGIVVVLGGYLIGSGIRTRRRRSQEQDTESSERESQLEGQMNKAFESEHEYEDIKLDRL